MKKGYFKQMVKSMIREVFASVQGEGPLVGYKQLFVRFSSCNLNCKYCDTEFKQEKSTEYSIQDLLEITSQNLDCHSISLTGGEPLLNIEFLKEFLPSSKLPVYLETNATLYKNLEQIINFVDFISADIKIPSCTGMKELWNEHDIFFTIASKTKLFAKMVFDSGINDNEIEIATTLCKKHNIELILQPKMFKDSPTIDAKFMETTLNKSLKYYSKVRLIPQVHKFISVR